MILIFFVADMYHMRRGGRGGGRAGQSKGRVDDVKDVHGRYCVYCAHFIAKQAHQKPSKSLYYPLDFNKFDFNTFRL
jgi:hypothetical protein